MTEVNGSELRLPMIVMHGRRLLLRSCIPRVYTRTRGGYIPPVLVRVQPSQARIVSTPGPSLGAHNVLDPQISK